MARPQPGEYGSFYQTYIDKTKSDTVKLLVENNSSVLHHFVMNLPEAKADYAYAAGKWTIKDLLQHMIDTERIMIYRALTIARNDKFNLPGFDENNYAIAANASTRILQSLKEEFVAVRKSTDLFLLSLTEEQLQQKGIANSHPITVNSLAYIIYGHALHHKQIIEERYL
ncbi:MAG TPA: DinB family protein [Chitinophagaceae bacterium]|nr:DinB family protein [Chitinophagaceae bacterium]